MKRKLQFAALVVGIGAAFGFGFTVGLFAALRLCGAALAWTYL